MPATEKWSCCPNCQSLRYDNDTEASTPEQEIYECRDCQHRFDSTQFGTVDLPVEEAVAQTAPVAAEVAVEEADQMRADGYKEEAISEQLGDALETAAQAEPADAAAVEEKPAE